VDADFHGQARKMLMQLPATATSSCWTVTGENLVTTAFGRSTGPAADKKAQPIRIPPRIRLRMGADRARRRRPHNYRSPSFDRRPAASSSARIQLRHLLQQAATALRMGRRDYGVWARRSGSHRYQTAKSNGATNGRTALRGSAHHRFRPDFHRRRRTATYWPRHSDQDPVARGQGQSMQSSPSRMNWTAASTC